MAQLYFDQDATLVASVCFPRPRYHGVPRLVVKGSKLHPKDLPTCLPMGPHRREFERHPPCLGLGRGVNLIPHQDQFTGADAAMALLPPIEKVQFANENDIDEDAIDENVLLPIYRSLKADMVRFTKNIMEPRPGLWQAVAPEWERAQIRYNQGHSYEVERRGAKPVNRLPRVESKMRFDNFKEPIPKLPPEVEIPAPKIPKFTRPTPGYGGYVPRYPVNPRPPEECPNLGLTNIHRTTYRLFPSYVYTKGEFAHQGPLSKSVTTTPPFNPFNKIDRLELNSDKLLWKRHNQSKPTRVLKIRH
ncbi:predicted protein [Nematostella vectensis]|uniref:Uncharacterized protein n=1 Tax=Nematostella vectensis TaxID=45351 RepID=A7RMF8_NEMVE|nr:uncharacterized protein LOC5519492 [Nematostella vectensis]EDO47265.1 predicted protein [Nematostella vectensis]|eukprot:XP_001639328.1 predicted protein [Nematostella vectensis]